MDAECVRSGINSRFSVIFHLFFATDNSKYKSSDKGNER